MPGRREPGRIAAGQQRKAAAKQLPALAQSVGPPVTREHVGAVLQLQIGEVGFHRCHLLRAQANGRVGARSCCTALKCCGVKPAGHGVGNHLVCHTVQPIAGSYGGTMGGVGLHRTQRGWRSLGRSLLQPRTGLPGHVHGLAAGHDAVELLGPALCGDIRIAPAIGAAIEVTVAWCLAEEGLRHCLPEVDRCAQCHVCIVGCRLAALRTGARPDAGRSL
ncbi:hypothetical protein D3C72_1341610 [compost metagenome]